MTTRSTIIAILLLICVYMPSRSQNFSYRDNFASADMVSCKLTDDQSIKTDHPMTELKREKGATFDISVYKGDDGTLHVRVLGENKVDVAMYIHDLKGEEIFYEPVCVGGNGEIIYSLNNSASGVCTVTAYKTNDKKEVIKKSLNF